MTRKAAFDIFADYLAVTSEYIAAAQYFSGEHSNADNANDDETNAADETQLTECDDDGDDWRPGGAPWDAPGMSVSDFIR